MTGIGAVELIKRLPRWMLTNTETGTRDIFNTLAEFTKADKQTGVRVWWEDCTHNFSKERRWCPECHGVGGSWRVEALVSLEAHDELKQAWEIEGVPIYRAASDKVKP